MARGYEAGREGFWLHRFLQAQGIPNYVVDSSSIEVNRRQRQAKGDGLDVRKLLSMLMRYEQGEREVWRVVHVPSVEADMPLQPRHVTPGSIHRACYGRDVVAHHRAKAPPRNGFGQR